MKVEPIIYPVEQPCTMKVAENNNEMGWKKGN